MIGRQFPARPVCGDLEPVPHPEVTPKGQAPKPAFQTDDMILLHRTPDRDRRHQRFRRQRRRSAQSTECLVYGCDQAGELIDGDRVFRNITLDDIRDQAGIDLVRRAFLSHIFSPALSRGGKYGSKSLCFQFFPGKYFPTTSNDGVYDSDARALSQLDRITSGQES